MRLWRFALLQVVQVVVLFIFLEIVARKLFNYSFQGVDELGGYILAVVAAVGQLEQ